MEPNDERSYVNALLTSLAGAPVTAVTLTPGTGVPNLDRVVGSDADREWVASIGFDYASLDGTKVIAALLTVAGWRFYQFGRREYTLSAALATPDAEPRPVRFLVRKDWFLSGPISLTRVT